MFLEFLTVLNFLYHLLVNDSRLLKLCEDVVAKKVLIKNCVDILKINFVAINMRGANCLADTVS